jgi:hypothetical protein
MELDLNESNGAGFERVQYRSLSASTFPQPKASKIIVLAFWERDPFLNGALYFEPMKLGMHEQ